MIILEGPDGAGKTTLGNMLLRSRIVSEVLQSPSRTRGNVPLLDQTLRYLRLHGKKPHIAVDRFIFSEMVYGPIIRGKCQFPVSFSLNLQMEMMLSGCFLIFCLPPTVEGLNLTAEKQMPGVEKYIEKIFNKYEEFNSRMSSIYEGVFRYNFSDPESYPTLTEKIRSFYGQR